MSDMNAVRKKLALDAISKPLARGPEGARQLARALRGVDALDNWKWSYQYTIATSDHSCGSSGCALGYTATFWPKQVGGMSGLRWLIEGHFSMEKHDGYKIFIGADTKRNIDMRGVTPEMVADDLDAWAAEEMERAR